MKKLLLLLFVFSLLPLKGMAQAGVPMQIEPGFFEICTVDNMYERIGVTDFWYSPKIACVQNLLQFPDANVKVYVDKISTSSTQCVMAFNAEKVGDCIKGKYFFNPETLGLNDPSYIVNGIYNGVGLIDAVRSGESLYILGDETFADVADLEKMVSEGKIRKLNLSEDKSFVFSFICAENGSTDFIIKSEATGHNDCLGFHNGVAVLYFTDLANKYYSIFHLMKVGDPLDEQAIIVNPNEVTQSRGSLNISLTVPEEEKFSATFDIVLPDKFTLDKTATKLSDELSGYDLSIINKGNGVWSFEIKPSGLRIASETSFREIVNVVYTVDKDLEDGEYNLIIKDLLLAIGDMVIEKEEVVVTIHYDSVTDNDYFCEADIYASDGSLYVNVTKQMVVNIYNMSGVIVKSLSVNAGEKTQVSLSRGFYVVKAGAVSKVVFVK